MSALPTNTPAVVPLSPLGDDRNNLLARLVENLDAPGLYWLSGYTAALAAQSAPQLRAPVSAPLRESNAQQRLTLVYGSQTGNAKRAAEQLARSAEAAGLAVRLLRADAYPTRELVSERLLYIVISTQGDGDPPDDARGLVEFLTGKRAPALRQLKYAVLGLGDSSYPKFCAVGQLLDARLAALGATRILARGDADLDFDSVVQPWLARALNAAREVFKSGATLATVTPLRAVPVVAALGTREQPLAAELLVNQRLTARASDRDVRHLEFSLQGSGLRYEPGDAIGVWPTNPPALVREVLESLRLDGDALVTHAGQTLPLAQWLAEKRELTRLARPFVASHAAQARNAELNRLLAPDLATPLGELLRSHQVIDLLRAYPAEWNADELVAALRPMTPRLYSIASSQKEVGDEVHTTVSAVAYQAFGSTHWGAASQYLANREDSARVPLFVEANERFRLPRDSARDVIMIGPGTGIAPFRGFVQERAATGAGGRNWLFFGNPHFDSDFLYQLEWQQALKRGSLQRLDLAFSRDQAEKVYVQRRLREHGRELYAWLDQGAHLYVCGDATRMARDVHTTLRDVVIEHGARNAEDAEAYLSRLIQERRYCRDVY